MKHLSYKNIDWQQTSYPGIQSHENDADTKGDRIRYFYLSKDAVIPSHNHLGYEKIVIMKGRVNFLELELSEGDILYAEKGQQHSAVAIEETLMLVINEKT
jgi:quercetin dioxygenase-like cupin family protein